MGNFWRAVERGFWATADDFAEGPHHPRTAADAKQTELIRVTLATGTIEAMVLRNAVVRRLRRQRVRAALIQLGGLLGFLGLIWFAAWTGTLVGHPISNVTKSLGLSPLTLALLLFFLLYYIHQWLHRRLVGRPIDAEIRRCLDEPACFKCGYSMPGVNMTINVICPECGHTTATRTKPQSESLGGPR